MISFKSFLKKVVKKPASTSNKRLPLSKVMPGKKSNVSNRIRLDKLLATENEELLDLLSDLYEEYSLIENGLSFEDWLNLDEDGWSAAGRGALSGLTFGYGDRAIAKAKSLWKGTNYDDELEKEREAEKKDAEEHPLAYHGGEVGSFVVGGPVKLGAKAIGKVGAKLLARNAVKGAAKATVASKKATDIAGIAKKELEIAKKAKNAKDIANAAKNSEKAEKTLLKATEKSTEASRKALTRTGAAPKFGKGSTAVMGGAGGAAYVDKKYNDGAVMKSGIDAAKRALGLGSGGSSGSDSSGASGGSTGSSGGVPAGTQGPVGKDRAVQYPRGDSGAGSPSGGNSPSGGARRALPSASSNDDLDQAKKMIKKREDAQSPIYKIGNAADKMFGGGKETASGVKDTYSRLAKDPKAAAEFKKIQQQRNKDMGIN